MYNEATQKRQNSKMRELTHGITIKCTLLHRELCSGCLLNRIRDACTLEYWTKREYVWYNQWTGEMRETIEDNSLTAEGWSHRTKRPQECIDTLG